MPNPENDRQVIAILAQKINLSEDDVIYDFNYNAIALNLSGQNLDEFPPLLGQLTRLQRLKISNNQLRAISPELGRLTRLQELNLNNNQLTAIPPELGQLTNLQDLYLSNNQLTTIPSELGQLASLQRLNLNNNQLTVLPPELGQLTSLQDLYLSSNQLTTIPSELGQLTNLQRFNLNNNQLTTIPQELGQLTRLQELYLGNNQLRAIPPVLGQLTSLQQLYLSYNQLTTIPPELGQLTHLQILYFNNNQLTTIPPELSQLTSLPQLYLSYNQLTTIPSELGQLANLQKLYLNDNQLTAIPPELGQLTSLQRLDLRNNQLITIPSELGQLTNLQSLDLNYNQLASIPPELGQLISLQKLDLTYNQLNIIPPELGQLIRLRELYLVTNQLTTIPPELGQLASLQELHLNDNQLTTIPPELGLLTCLQRLNLENNQLTAIPPELGLLTSLLYLALDNNQLTAIPLELCQLTRLQKLDLDNNPHLLTVPPEIVAQGTGDILSFLRELQINSVTRYEAKLLVVGEGGTGKSSLLRALRNQTFDPALSTTHGIEVDLLQLPYPNQSSLRITLNTWDFGGQQIYHATHQFFLTKRSLYLLIWNARLGAEQGRLHYWLETIKALAPEAPVLLVATHIDERAPDLNYQLYRDTYPQIIGHINVSNATKKGIAELRKLLAQCAIKLPVMGQLQPEKWLKAEESLTTRPEHHIDTELFTQICLTEEVSEDLARGTFGNYLHDLGKILYFQDDYVLRNLVVLKPNWVTKAISRVLTDEGVRKMHGILLHARLPRIWVTDEDGRAYPTDLYPAFLRLMERFYLSYQIESDAPGDYARRSLIPQLLPYEPPANLASWPITPALGQTQIEMVYRFDFLPEGIMSWFIVRTHRYTQNQHWRDGVVLAYQDHYARVELNPMKREIRLLVWGVQPHNFFTILMNTVDTILARFEGLKVLREIPCICHWRQPAQEPCPHFYSYDELTRRMELQRYKIECPESFLDVAVPLLLYGIHTSTDQQVMDNLQDGQQKIASLLQEMKKEELQKLEKLEYELQQQSLLVRQQSELLIRNFTRLWNLEMHKIEVNCPNTFILLPGSDTIFNPKNWVSRAYKLRLVCQHPSAPHPVGEAYALRKDAKWWVTINPWLNRLIEFLKFAVPMGKAIEALYDINTPDVKQLQATIGLVEQITNDLKDLPDLDEMKDIARHPQTGYDSQYVGSALRALHHYLQEVDPTSVWGGLQATLTPDGNILWLCGKHREEYEAKPLKLDIL